ncbi:MAG: class I SAM-dependent methyltransferase [Gemmataceae bacterium]
MNRFLHGVARSTFEAFPLSGPVLEVGAFQVAGQEQLIDLRRYFPGRRYVGLDMRPGPGVDQVASVEALPYADGTFGTVIALSTFEHVARFWQGFDEVYRVLRPDGALVVSCPFHFHLHAHPDDYWRFTPSALKLLLARYPQAVIGWHGPRHRPINVWAAAFRERYTGFTPAAMARYRTALQTHAREPLSPFRKLRYTLGRLLCGSRPFAPWLLRDRWELEVVRQPSRRGADSPLGEAGGGGTTHEGRPVPSGEPAFLCAGR